MKKASLISAVTAIFAVVFALGVAWAGGLASIRIGATPLLVLCAALAFSIQWLAFLPAFALQTEKFYDSAGCVTYLSVLGLVASLGPPLDAADVVLLLMCTVWAVRLGVFLFLRIHKDGADHRFDAIKPDFLRFLMAWTLQGLWVFLTLSAVLIVTTVPGPHPISAFTVVGALIWLAGFGLEVTADAQKRTFKADKANQGRFIQTGLWAWSRHPNYLGEMILWAGVFVCVLPQLQGWQWIALISPCFVALLLTKVSGVPLLEAHANKRWGQEPSYQAYKKATPVLWPWRT